MTKSDYHLAVNKGLLITGRDLNRTRWRVESERLRLYCPGWKLELRRQNGEKTMTKTMGSVKCGRKAFDLIIKIPNHYPYKIPTVFTHRWSTGDSPHVYNNGALCVMKSDQWRSIYSLALVVKKATVWIHKYLSWKKKSRWPGRAQD